MNTQIDLSKLCGRKLSDEEAARIREVASNLELRDDDAIWQLLAAMEYQRVYYEKLPAKIGAATSEIIKGISKAVDKETENAQAKLAETVVKEANRLSSKIQWGKIVPILLMTFLIAMLYGALAMWCGYQLGAGKLIPVVQFLLLPNGLILGSLFHIAPFIYIGMILDEYEGKKLVFNILFGLLMLFIGMLLFYFTGRANDIH